jgi:ubiquitin carboxyl-terminal hydrolase 1
LFQLVSECIKSELADVDKEGHRDRGLGGLGFDKINTPNREVGKSVFDGLTANRRSCMECGYTEAVMHFSFDNWQLAVPRLSSRCRLEDCLQDYTRLELLTDCICRRCSMLATHQRLVQDYEKLKVAVESEPNPSTSKKKRYKEAKRMEAKVKAALAEGRIEEDIKDLKMEKVFSKASTKQAMIARPPPVLALHLNRSLHYGSYAAKNTIVVQFPELLDLTPFTTSGKLSVVPSAPMSTTPPVHPRSTTPTPSTYATPRTMYRLASVVCHYGQHSFGHYICYRRKPRPLDNKSRWNPPRLLSDPIAALQRASSISQGAVDYAGGEEAVWAEDDLADVGTGTGRGWLRISDDSVSEVGIESVLAQGSAAFMLYYERVSVSPYSHSPIHEAAMASDETLKPVATLSGLTNGAANGSMTSLASDTTSELSSHGSSRGRVVGPRIIRNMSTRRARSLESTPSSEASSLNPDLGSIMLNGSAMETMSTSLPTTFPSTLTNGHANPVPQEISPIPSPPLVKPSTQPNPSPSPRASKKASSGSLSKSLEFSNSSNSFVQSPRPLLPSQPAGLRV